MGAALAALAALAAVAAVAGPLSAAVAAVVMVARAATAGAQEVAGRAHHSLQVAQQRARNEDLLHAPALAHLQGAKARESESGRG